MKKVNKLRTLLIMVMILFPIVGMMVPVNAVSYSLVTIDSQTTHDTTGALAANGAYPASLGEYGQCFVTPTAYNGLGTPFWNLRQVKYFLASTGSPNGVLEAILFASTGSLAGQNCTPTGSSLAVSNTQTLTSINGFTSFFTFNFPYFQLQSGTVYAISIRVVSCVTCDVTDDWIYYSQSGVTGNVYQWGGSGYNGIIAGKKSTYEVDGDPAGPFTQLNSTFVPLLSLVAVSVGIGFTMVFIAFKKSGIENIQHLAYLVLGLGILIVFIGVAISLEG